MQKLTKETAIWTVVLAAGIVVLVSIQLWQILSPILPPLDFGFNISASVPMTVVVLAGFMLGIFAPAFFYRLVVILVASEAEFSYGVSVFYMTFMAFISQLIQMVLITFVEMFFDMDINWSIVIGTILLACGGYCALLVYNKTITVKQALICGVILGVLSLIIPFGLITLIKFGS